MRELFPSLFVPHSSPFRQCSGVVGHFALGPWSYCLFGSDQLLFPPWPQLCGYCQYWYQWVRLALMVWQLPFLYKVYPVQGFSHLGTNDPHVGEVGFVGLTVAPFLYKFYLGEGFRTLRKKKKKKKP